MITTAFTCVGTLNVKEMRGGDREGGKDLGWRREKKKKKKRRRGAKKRMFYTY